VMRQGSPVLGFLPLADEALSSWTQFEHFVLSAALPDLQ